MTVGLGLVYIVVGAALLLFGLLIYYGVLHVFYALLGAVVGYGVGAALTGSGYGSPGLVEVVLAVVGGVLFWLAARGLDRLRKVLSGALLGALLGLAVAQALALSGAAALVAAVVGALILGFLANELYEPIIILSTALSGAALLLDGLFLALALDFLNRDVRRGDVTPLLIWLVLAAIGAAWQFSQRAQWGRRQT